MPHEEPSSTIGSAEGRGGICANLGRLSLERLEEAFRVALGDEGDEPLERGVGHDGRLGSAFHVCDGPLPEDCATVRAAEVRLA